MIALGCDHGGYNLICAIKKYLDEKGLEYKEYGTFSEESVNDFVSQPLSHQPIEITNLIDVIIPDFNFF